MHAVRGSKFPKQQVIFVVGVMYKLALNNVVESIAASGLLEPAKE